MTIRQSSATAGYNKCVTATASDTVSQPTGVCDAFVFLTTGAAVTVDVEGNSNTFTAIPAGVVIPLKLSRVNSTGYTAVVGFLYY